ncbi:MAG: hypothetical protein M3Y54_09415, partial [Bacteroidota bacterium]|nr:hypothetical protein [Bacteroidota bacterium]
LKRRLPERERGEISWVFEGIEKTKERSCQQPLHTPYQSLRFAPGGPLVTFAKKSGTTIIRLIR